MCPPVASDTGRAAGRVRRPPGPGRRRPTTEEHGRDSGRRSRVAVVGLGVRSSRARRGFGAPRLARVHAQERFAPPPPSTDHPETIPPTARGGGSTPPGVERFSISRRPATPRTSPTRRRAPSVRVCCRKLRDSSREPGMNQGSARYLLCDLRAIGRRGERSIGYALGCLVGAAVIAGSLKLVLGCPARPVECEGRTRPALVWCCKRRSTADEAWTTGETLRLHALARDPGRPCTPPRKVLQLAGSGRRSSSLLTSRDRASHCGPFPARSIERPGCSRRRPGWAASCSPLRPTGPIRSMPGIRRLHSRLWRFSKAQSTMSRGSSTSSAPGGP